MLPSKIQKFLKKSSKIEPTEYWTCSFCRFRNKNMKAIICHICEFPRPSKLTPKSHGFPAIPEEFTQDILKEKEEESFAFEKFNEGVCPQCGTEIDPNKEKCVCGALYIFLADFLSSLHIQEEKEKESLQADTLPRGVEILPSLVPGQKIHFSVWFPDARKVFLLGDFNNFGAGGEKRGSGFFEKEEIPVQFTENLGASQMPVKGEGKGLSLGDQFRLGRSGSMGGKIGIAGEFKMKKDSRGVFTFELSSDENLIGSQFKYLVFDEKGRKEWRNDPRSVYLKGPNNRLNDVIYNPNAFEWSDQYFKPPELNQMVIYETHIVSLGDGTPAHAFVKAIGALDYLKKLGVNTIELMPINQEAHELCWGYDVTSLFAVQRQFGSPDELKMFINEAHLRGLSVLLDWVPNHLSKKALLPPCYFPPRNSPLNPTGYGPRPDYSNLEVRRYIIDSLKTYLFNFHFDGVRVDSVETMRLAGGYEGGKQEIADAWSLMQEVIEECRKEGGNKIFIAEDLQNDGRINRLMGFDAQWDAGFFSIMLNVVKAIDDKHRNLYKITKGLTSRFESSGFGRVIYTENHDTVPEDREGRMPMSLNVQNGKPDIFAKKRARMVSALCFCTVGIPMLLIGQEYLELKGGKWPELCVKKLNLEDLTEEQERNLFFYRDLIALRLNKKNITKGLMGSNFHVIYAHGKEDEPVIVFHRWDKGGKGDDVIVVANFSNHEYLMEDGGFWISFPRGGEWLIRLSTSAFIYRFEDTVEADIENVKTVRDEQNIDGYFHRGQVHLNSYSLIILSQEP